MHPLRVMLDAAALGVFPPADGAVDVVEPAADGWCAIVEFTGHAVVMGEMSLPDLAAMGADGLGGASRAEVKLALAGPGGWIGCQDAVLVTTGRGDGVDGPLHPRDDLEEHPRVVLSRAHRNAVEVFGDDTGFVTIGDGLVGRREISVELFAGTRRDASAGRALIAAGLCRVPTGDHVWAQVSPGNAASLRAFLAAGFVPVGAETLIVPAP